MKYLVNIKGYRKAGYINGATTNRWYIFYVTRKPYAEGVTGMETSRCEVEERIFRIYGPPICGKVYEVEYGPNNILTEYRMLEA